MAGLSPELLREAAGEIEQLVEVRLLEIDPSVLSYYDWTLYRMPDWLWLALHEVIRRVPQRRIELRDPQRRIELPVIANAGRAD